MYRRALQCIPGSDNCVQLPYAVDEQGNVMFAKITDAREIPVRKAVADGGVLITENNEIQMANLNGNGLLPFATLPAETATGGRKVVREETASYVPNIKQFQLSLSNTDTNPVEMVVFDGMGLVANKLKLGSLPGTVTVGGTWGTSTLAFLKSIGQSMPTDLHQVWMQNLTLAGAKSTAFFDTGYIREAYADIAGNSLFDEPLPAQTLLTDESYQENIRIFRGFRYQVNPLAAVHLYIPAETTINITFNVSAIGTSYGMVKQSGNESIWG